MHAGTNLHFSPPRPPTAQNRPGMDDSDKELKLVKQPFRRLRFQITDKDGDEDPNIDLEPSSKILSARSAKLQSNSAQTISRGGPAFCRYLYDAPSVNPSPVNHNPPVDTSSSDTPKLQVAVSSTLRLAVVHLMSVLDCCTFTEIEFSWRTHRPTLVHYTLHLTASYMDSCT